MAGALAKVALLWPTGMVAAGTAAVMTGAVSLDPIMDRFAIKPEATEMVAIAKPAPPVETRVAAEPAADLETPSFDILRVEENGSVLVAGRAPKGATVELIDRQGTVLATGEASAIGEFVILPDDALAPGDYSFTLRATGLSVNTVWSRQGAVVKVPGRDAGTKTLAMVVEDGAPSRIVAKPFTKPVQVASLAPPVVEVPKPAPVVTRKPEPVVKGMPVAPLAKPAVKNSAAVIVEAVEIERGTVFVAGAVKRGSSVRVYINNKPVGTARGTVDDRFLVKRKFPLSQGRHTVRADVIAPKAGTVIARAEVPLLHEVEPATKPAAVKPVTNQDGSPERPTSIPIRTGSAIIIKPGDNLWRISRRNYGRGIRYTTIYNANRDQIRDPSRIYVGQIFKLPTR